MRSKFESLIWDLQTHQNNCNLETDDVAALLWNIMESLEWDILSDEDRKVLEMIAWQEGPEAADEKELHLTAANLRSFLNRD